MRIWQLFTKSDVLLNEFSSKPMNPVKIIVKWIEKCLGTIRPEK